MVTIVCFFIGAMTVGFLGLLLFGLLSFIWPALIPLSLVLLYREHNIKHGYRQDQS